MGIERWERRDIVRWFKLILPPKIDDPIPPEGMNTDQEKQWRISLLTDDECKAFQWFQQGYTARWTTETMLLDRKTAKRLFDSIYHKLRVADEAEVSRVYRGVRLTPEDLPPEENDP
ncbi:MAG TPA: hypothetical protein PKD52_01955 [Clostridiales bacterium]|nr:hypothetical protein [Clostridiales bacterium]